jgi:hypothetical protein
LIAREIDHVAGWRYDFFNHCCPRGFEASVIAERFRSNVQRNAQILAEKLRQEWSRRVAISLITTTSSI